MPETSANADAAEDSGIDDWTIAIVIVLILLFVALVGGLAFLVVKVRQQKA